MTTPPPKQWGCTPPISNALPTPDEVAANDRLISELKAQNNFEAPAETERRKHVMQFFQRVTTEFVRSVGQKKGQSQAALEVGGGKVFTYGSYRLGVYGPGSDIDTLIAAPKYVMIDDFFADFPSTLERMSPPNSIEKLTPVPDAFVPIIKIEYSGISIDLIFARLDIHSVPLDLDLKNTNLLRGLDDKEMRSVNGTRVTDEILELVPQQKTFRLALRAIKLYAQRRAIYANIVGFPGGVAWAMLVARVCQLYPQATGAVIIGKFFRIMNQWNWPQPVLLKPIEDGPLQAKIWNPKIYPGDRYHLMPIITPAYPSMCATHNISQSTKAVLLRELKRGGDIVDKIFKGQLQWSDLFARNSFFTRDYKYYLSIMPSSTNKEAQSMWSGLVESKLRHLVGALDRRKTAIQLAHPFPQGFERIHKCKSEYEVEAVKNGSTQFQVQADGNPEKTEQIAQDGADNIQTLYTTTYYIGVEIKALPPGAPRSLDISADTEMFRFTCTSWPQFQPGVNDLSIMHVRNYDLPDDVFFPGDVRPTRPKKKVVKTIHPHPPNGKRSIESTDHEQPPVKRQVSDATASITVPGTGSITPSPTSDAVPSNPAPTNTSAPGAVPS